MSASQRKTRRTEGARTSVRPRRPTCREPSLAVAKTLSRAAILARALLATEAAMAAMDDFAAEPGREAASARLLN